MTSQTSYAGDQDKAIWIELLRGGQPLHIARYFNVDLSLVLRKARSIDRVRERKNGTTERIV